jgi:haloalkane dehalogenase
MLICWGGEDFCFNDHFYMQWRQRFPAALHHYFPEAGHYVLEDALEEIMVLLPPFLASCDD